MTEDGLSPGDPWTDPYRGMTLHMGGDNRIWWHPYRGHGRLYLEDAPDELVTALDRVKPAGAQFRVTEQNDVLAKVEDEQEGSYDPVWAGRLETSSPLIVEEDPENPTPKASRTVELEPAGLSPGDLWPSVYDGTRFSMTDQETVWWEDSGTHYRHDITGIPRSILDEMVVRKPAGGSFRVTPWGDAITLVGTVPRPDHLIEQQDDLPRPVQQIIWIRKERGLNMLPVYLGSFDPADIEIEEPARLDKDLTAQQDEEIRAWIKSLGPSSTTSESSAPTEEPPDGGEAKSTFDDDPEEWAIETLGDEALEDDRW